MKFLYYSMACCMCFISVDAALASYSGVRKLAVEHDSLSRFNREHSEEYQQELPHPPKPAAPVRSHKASPAVKTSVSAYKKDTSSCLPIQPRVEEQIADASMVFEGKIIGIAAPLITFRVMRIWKGGPEKEIAILSNAGECSFQKMEVGDSMLIFARGEPLASGIKDGSYRIATARGELLKNTLPVEAILGHGHVPRKRTAQMAQ